MAAASIGRVPRDPSAPRSRWRPTPPRLARLMAGLAVLGTGEALMVAANLGNNPWIVLAQGVAVHSALGIGTATVAISFCVLLLWLPLRQRPGLGTLLNAGLLGLFMGAMVEVLPRPGAVAGQYAFLLMGIPVIAAGAALYITADLGTGPRDGLMTGLHLRTGRSIRLTRTAIEAGALAGGWALGGTVGVGTLLFALLIGPAVQRALSSLGWDPRRESHAYPPP